jgi:regulation of enolase protein 1 (concanavalin A-like superfamily)
MFTAVLLAALAPAAPVPKDLETREKKLERLFGTPSQPDGAKVELDGTRLKVSVPHLPAGKPGEAGVYGCPRTGRTVSGDFEFTCVVTVTTPADVPVDAWAGVYVGFDDRHHFDFMRWLDTGRNRKGPGAARGVWSQVVTAKGQANVVGHGEKDVPTATLRIVRKGDELTAHAKYPGGDWEQAVKATVALPKDVTVGVYVGGRKGPLTAEFEDFSVTKPGK